MKQGQITNVEYQRLFMDLEKQKKTINSEFIRFKYDAIQEIEESGFITSLMGCSINYILDDFEIVL